MSMGAIVILVMWVFLVMGMIYGLALVREKLMKEWDGKEEN